MPPKSKPYFPTNSRFFIFLLIFCTLIKSKAQNNNPIPCPPSSCGNIQKISYPFRLRGDPTSCGYDNPNFELDCLNNQTIFRTGSSNFYVQEIDYESFAIRLVDPNINRGNLSTCPVYPTAFDIALNLSEFEMFGDMNVPVAFIHCLNNVDSSSSRYVRASFCGNKTNIFSNSSEIFSYVMVGEDYIRPSDLEDSCTVDRVDWASTRRIWRDNSSLAGIYDGLRYGFEFSWYRVPCGECERTNGFCAFSGDSYRITCRRIYCRNYISISENPLRCQLQYIGYAIGIYAALAAAGLSALKFFFGFPFLMGLVLFKWRRRHLSMDETIEEFLRGQNNLTPIKYTYSEIKKMTNNFSQRLGEGGYGIVYKGKLRSGPYVAVKMMGESVSSEEEFISEVGTIGRIHHVNVVRLIGFCVEGSKCGLVYEYLPNGSLDRYIFSQQSLEASALRYDKMFEIALGVARGINYLHHGCDIQILHFDIKPHNILLDENFSPKISDFGLAKLYKTDGSIIDFTSARGTMGYMAPEMFYKNVGGVSYKADVYSFGMLLMEIAGRRKNMNPFADDVSQIYFPSWAYDQLYAGEEIEMKDATEEERKMVKKIIIVALWCIQMRPSDRPSMNKVVDMLEGNFELQMPPKPFLAPHEIAEDHVIKKHEILLSFK